MCWWPLIKLYVHDEIFVIYSIFLETVTSSKRMLESIFTGNHENDYFM